MFPNDVSTIVKVSQILECRLDIIIRGILSESEED